MQVPFEDFLVALFGLAEWLREGGVHEVLQLFVDEEVDAASQQRLNVKHLALNALDHSYQFSQRRLL